MQPRHGTPFRLAVPCRKSELLVHWHLLLFQALLQIGFPNDIIKLFCRVLQERRTLLHLLPGLHLQHAPDVCGIPPDGCSLSKHGHCFRSR